MKEDLLDPIEGVQYRQSVVETVKEPLKAWLRERGWTCQIWEDPPGA